MKNVFALNLAEEVKNKIVTYAAVLVATLIMLFPSTTSAFDALDQSVTQLTEDTFLFQIDYRLNYQTYDTYAPVLAYQVNQVSTTSPYIQYSLVDESGDQVDGIASASIVLSEAELVDKQYYFADRDASPFTLMSIVQISPAMVEAGGSLALQVDWLPFTLSKDGEEQHTAVPPADLPDFKTSHISW